MECWPGREFAIPSYAVDKHTRRGGSGGGGVQGETVKGVDTRPSLQAGARYWGVDISSFSEKEKAKSHGDGVE